MDVVVLVVVDVDVDVVDGVFCVNAPDQVALDIKQCGFASSCSKIVS